MSHHKNKHTYFWNEFDENARNWFNLQFFENRFIIGLGYIYACFMSIYFPECKEAECWLSRVNREKFFAYLLPILERGELKVKVSDKVLRVSTKEELEKYPHYPKPPELAYFSENTKEYNTAKQASDAIADIKERWNSIIDDDTRMHFEEWGVIFTLPENEWAI